MANEKELFKKVFGKPVLTPAEWRLIENFLAARIQLLIRQRAKARATEQARNIIQQLKNELHAHDTVTIVVKFEISFTMEELLNEFKRERKI